MSRSKAGWEPVHGSRTPTADLLLVACSRELSEAPEGCGQGKAGRAVKKMHALLEDLTRRVIDGELETARGAVANQLIGTRIRLFEYERRLKEVEELEERLEAVEGVLKGRQKRTSA